MGFLPEHVDRMGLWEFAACAHGYAKAHGSRGDGPGREMSDERMRDLGLL